MNVRYLVQITDPETHIVKVRLSGKRDGLDKLSFFLPSWSPGSYLMREYARNVRKIMATSERGEPLYLIQREKGVWDLEFDTLETKKEPIGFELEYEIYCHELSVRTSHVDYSHAFLHGPSYLMGIKGEALPNCEIEFEFTKVWSKLHTALEDISTRREKFIYRAEDYDHLIDSPVEIGCHESDGFHAHGKDHHLVFYGTEYPHDLNLKADIKKVVEYVGELFSSVPYKHYFFITHFCPNLYGGLEHHDSTALHFDGRILTDRKSYLNWLCLVSHEYFHTWNVKRIRPKALGPFDYTSENYTRMHWLTEGLTSFIDEISVYNAGLMELNEYLEMQKDNLVRYFSIPGKRFHSLEDSSFNAWIKLYRPDENSNNSSVSYYLKGGLVFSTLHFELKKQGKSIKDLLALLWDRYQSNQTTGLTKAEVMEMIESLAGVKVREQFDLRLSTTEDIDFETYYKEIGCEFVWDETKVPWLGVDFKTEGDRVIVSSVVLDGPAYKAGLNAGDEILAVNRLRFLKGDIEKISKLFNIGKNYNIQISRLNKVFEVTLQIGQRPKLLKEIAVKNAKKAKAAFSL